MSETQPLPHVTVAGVEVPTRRGFRIAQARTVLNSIQTAISTPEKNPTDMLQTYLASQGIGTASDIILLRRALETPMLRKGIHVTDKDRAILASLTDIIGRLQIPKKLLPEDLGPRETARDIGRGRLRYPR